MLSRFLNSILPEFLTKPSENNLRAWLEFIDAGDVRLEPEAYAQIEKLYSPALQAEYRVAQRHLDNNFAKRGLRAALQSETVTDQPAKVLPFRLLPDPQNEDNQIA